jgi:hypothetical protein
MSFVRLESRAASATGFRGPADFLREAAGGVLPRPRAVEAPVRPADVAVAKASPHLLLLSVSAGHGHVKAAQALEAEARLRPGPCTSTHLDAMAHVNGAFRKVYTAWYLQLLRHAPEVWSYLHHKTDSTPHDALAQRLRRGIERLCATSLLDEVRRLAPDAIVCTHFLPAELLMRERDQGRLHCPVWLQVTDYDLHNMWLVPNLSGYLAATEEVAFRMRARGLPADRIHVTGIPVMPAFALTAASARATCRGWSSACSPCAVASWRTSRSWPWPAATRRPTPACAPWRSGTGIDSSRSDSPTRCTRSWPPPTWS